MEVRVRTIESDDDLTAAFARIDEIWLAEPGTPEDAELDVLTYLVERYERVHYPIPRASPLDMIRFYMEQQDKTQSDLATLFGSRSRASEVLSGKRDLSMEQIRKLHREWRLPVASLISDLVDAS